MIDHLNTNFKFEEIFSISPVEEMMSVFAHELNQSLMIINTYLLGCIKRLEEENANIEPIISVMYKTIKQVDILSNKINALKNLSLKIQKYEK